MTRVALATCAELPALWMDDMPLVAGLRARGAQVDPAVWNDPAVDWSAYDVVVIRSTWDYTGRRDEFVAWADRVGAVTTLRNPAGVVRWNTEKTYLRSLATRGVAVVPTVWADPGLPVALADVMAANGWAEGVVKPAVSAGARDTVRFRAGGESAAQELLDRLARSGTALVQPYLRSVETYGERSLVFLGGEFSHAVRRQPSLTGVGFGRDAEAVPADPAELDFAVGVLAAVGEPLLYARVDLVRDAAGQLCLMELEAVEPQLFLRYAPDSAARLADLILRSHRRDADADI